MTVGSSIFLIVLGAILAFGVDITVSGLDLDVIGYVLIFAGVVGLVIGLFLYTQRNRARGASSTTVVQDSLGNETVRRTDSRLDGPGPAGPGTPL